MTLKKTNWGAMALATVTMTAMLASPQAEAHKKHTKKKAGKRHAVTQTYSRHSYSHSSHSTTRVDTLEDQVRALQAEVDALRAQGSAAPAVADTQTAAKVQELDQWMAEEKAKPAKGKNHQVFFRGGFAGQDHHRFGVSIPKEGNDLGLTQPGDDDAFYIGAGFDYSITDDLFGLARNTELLAEVMFEYKDFGRSNGVGVSTDGAAAEGELAGATGSIANATLSGKRVSVSQFSLTAAPKIKFLKGSAFRPWIIPVGLGIHVISPPSQSITVLNPGIMFGGGADYNLWKNLYVGFDARYHLTSNYGDGVNTDGYTAGGYIGFGF